MNRISKLYTICFIDFNASLMFRTYEIKEAAKQYRVSALKFRDIGYTACKPFVYMFLTEVPGSLIHFCYKNFERLLFSCNVIVIVK